MFTKYCVCLLFCLHLYCHIDTGRIPNSFLISTKKDVEGKYSATTGIVHVHVT